ncbi:AAEL003733-PA [Aedes aegypti]|uniref:ubiquitinyl hydrolase 1 n=1 Tax=Aedes aegypti TaxID=7159 RepID=Q17EP1_AEDAE|nr:AAEL003733-PA [Aedes aegypti]
MIVQINALASTLYTPASAGAGGAGGYKGTVGRKQHRTKRRQSNASSVMSSSDGSGVYEFVPYESRRYPSSQHHHHHPQTVATFPNPVAPEYHYQPRHHSTYSQQFPYSSSNASSVDGSGGFGRHPAASKRTANIRTQDHQANPGRNSHHYNYHHYQQQQQHQQQHSWSPVAVAASTIAATTGIIATTTTSTSSYTLPNSSVNTNLEATYTEYGESEQRLSCSAHSSSTNSSSSYRVVSGRNYSSRTGERVAASTPDGTTTAISEASTTTTMPPHTNNPHYPSQQQQQTQQGQPPQTQQGNPPPNSHNVAVNVSRGSSDQQSVVASAPQQMYPSQHYMTGGPPGNAMYPMPVIPQPIPGNVYVSNLTANVNVHGFVPHGMPQYVTTGASPAPTGAYITGEVPSGHEMQIMTPRGEARGGMRRNGRSGRIGHNTRPRGGFVPHYIAQQQTVMQSSQPAGIHHQQQPGQVQGQLPQQGVQQSQQQQSQSQSQNQSQSQPSQPPQQHTPDMVQHSMSMEHQPIMSPAQPVTYGGYGGYYFYPPFYPSVTPGHHPSAQHAAGAPILQVPMYQTMYSYSPSVVYQPMYSSEYPLYDGKGEDHNPQQPPEDGVMHQDMWQQPTMIEYNPENVEYIPPEEDMNMMQQGPPTMQPITHLHIGSTTRTYSGTYTNTNAHNYCARDNSTNTSSSSSNSNITYTNSSTITDYYNPCPSTPAQRTTSADTAVDKTSEMSTNSSKPVPNQQSQQHHQSQFFVNSNKSQTSTEEVARLQRTVQEKLVFKDDRRNGPYWTNPGSQPPATTISSFTSSTTTIVQHNSSQQQKKTTASVSVSAIPNKEYTSSSSTSSGPSVISSTKPYQKNTSPVPFTTLGTTSAPPSIHKQPLAPQKSYSSSEHHTATPVNSGPVMESKKVEAIPQRDSQINTPLPPPGLPPSLSVPPPQRQYTQGQMIVQTPYVPPPPATTAAAPQTKSWASLFNPSSSSATSTPGPTSSIVQPIATSAPVAPSLLAAGPALPTPSPFAPSFVPTQHRSSHSSSASNQSADKTTAASSSTSNKPIAKVSPFDKSNNNSNSGTTAMSYSAASAQGLPSASAGHTTSASASAASTASAGSKNKNNAAAQAQAAAAAAKPEQIDENTLKLGEFLSAYQIENNSISILPRGLINRSNYCYINAILQALVACPPFYHLMRAIRSLPAARNSKHQKPFIDAMSALVDEFSTLQLRSKVQRDKTKKDETPEIQCDSPMEPLMIHRMLNLLRSDIFQVEGRQEDAEEFLGCVLNRLNDEMIELMKLSKNESDVNGDDAANGEVHPDDQDDWKVIRGNRNKGTVTRTTDFGRSPMSDIFGGKLRSRVHREGDHATDNIQPFFTLQLDIEKATSVKDALDLLVGKDQLEGVTCSKTKQEIAAWQQVTLEELPIVMILHLKCFDYKMDGCTKILKALEFPIELKIDSKLMSSKGKSYTAKQKQYKLFAVVYHDGKEASKGHYITDVFHAGYGSWIRYDDSTVKPVSENNVLHPKSPRVPYLLYYRRLDTHYHGSAGGAGATTSGSTGTGGSGYGSGSSSSNTTSSSNNSSTGGNSNYSSSVNAGGHYGGSK